MTPYDDPALSARAVAVYDALGLDADDQGVSRVGLDEVAEYLRLSERVVANAVELLVARGHLRRVGSRPDLRLLS